MPKEKRRSSIHDITSFTNGGVDSHNIAAGPSQQPSTAPPVYTASPNPTTFPAMGSSLYALPAVGQPVALGTPVPIAPPSMSMPYVVRPHLASQVVVSGAASNMAQVMYSMPPPASSS